MKRTPLYREHVKLGAKIVAFSDWEMPLNYSSGILAEHLATRKFGGLFDISHMGRFRISDRDALPFLQYVLTNNAAALLPGQAQYTILANENGGAIDDTYLYRIDETDYILVVNAANLEKDWAWLQEHKQKFPQSILEDYSEKIAMLSLQGPGAKAVLERILGSVKELPDPGRNNLITAEISGTQVPIARTGYTGEPLCFELFPPAEIAGLLWNRLLEVGKNEGIVPVGLGARDTLRLEAGLPLYGHELGIDAEGKEIPIFALPVARFAISFGEIKGDYIGREALLRQFEEIKLRMEARLDTPKEQLVVPRVIMPMLITNGSVARGGCQVYVGDNLVGTVTSGTVVPYWNMEGASLESKPGTESRRRNVCLAYIDADLKAGQKTKVVIRDKITEGIIVKGHLSSEAAPYARPLFFKEYKKYGPQYQDESLENKARNLVKKAVNNTEWRQKKTVNLIPSEQTKSPLVRLLTIADPSERYAEHRKLKALGDIEVYYYQGIDFIAGVEQELTQRMKEYFECSEIEPRLISGQTANMTVFSGILDYINAVNRKAEPRRLRSVMNHHIGRGGHLSAQPMGGLRDYIAIDPVTERRAVVNFPVLADNPYQIDLAETAKLIEQHKPELIIFGKSMILHHEPVKEIARMITGIKPKPIVMYDGAHVLGLLGPYFQKPLQEGADIITGSTHKTFFGTQRGIIASNMSEDTDYFELWESITRRAFPGSVSNHHLGTLLGLLMATYEMETYGDDYQQQVITNAKVFALALKERGLQVEGDPKINYTETHQVILRVGYARGIEVARRLENNNIIVNYQGLPDDEAFTSSSGLRLGVQEMTRFGMKERDFEELSEYIADVVLKEKEISRQVSDFRSKFTDMKYCLPEEQAKPLVNELLSSLL